ncbi:oxygen-insensitive NAD(P)H-dependent nitroreductase NfsB [Saprospira grandis]|uniref:Dihydropteridine reductase n=1 Tax=Saprospira grandis (strain Lewin) TaxID=984262 RepID=H6L7L8_SAPGL|nr:oxygen-insensitive NAD(P)H-dependent nitroreductase NfsB [Saprospira grandis]AFC23050.1 dihydropteridine reductase [Saprospira grandis str. Lewin]WBM74837.1 oxygen-insensitive NAD(P)H-dependent nitroreductase NfsB [Saprospira grandis]
MDIIKTLNWRYSTKEFDPEKKISAEDVEKIKALLRMSPSSTNIQPWHFIIADNEEGKKRIAKGTQGFFQFNEKKVLDASHVILFCSRTDADDQFMTKVLEQEDKDGRFPNEEIKNMVDGGRRYFADLHRYDFKDFQHWMEKQVYLNMGNLLLGAAAMEIDSLPMEGIDLKALDEEFSLREKGYTSVAVIALGYRSSSDFNATTPKSRLELEDIITMV